MISQGLNWEIGHIRRNARKRLSLMRVESIRHGVEDELRVVQAHLDGCPGLNCDSRLLSGGYDVEVTQPVRRKDMPEGSSRENKCSDSSETSKY